MKQDDTKERIREKINIVEYINAVSPVNSDNKCICPFPDHDDKTGSLHITPDKNVWHCHGCLKGGDIFKFVQLYFNKSFPESIEILAKYAKIKIPKKKKIACTYNYCDETGILKYQVVRWIPKTFSQRQPSKESGKEWEWTAKGIVPLPYRLDRWHDKKQVLFFVEGEKDADNLYDLGVLATSSHGGAGKFRDELIPYFKDKVVVIIPDNDKAGRDHAVLVGTKLSGTARLIRILTLPDQKDKQDPTDWIEAGGTKDLLIELAKSSQAFKTMDFPRDPPQSTTPTETRDKVSKRAVKPNDLPPSFPIPQAGPSQGPTPEDSPSPLALSCPLPPFQWPHQNERQKPLNTEENMRFMLTAYGIKPAYNVIKKEEDYHIPGVKYSSTNTFNCSLTKIKSLCQLNGLAKENADDYIKLIADENPVNPIFDWIINTPHDATPRLQKFYDSILVKPGFPTEMRDLLLRKWMISACAACDMDQGYIGKGVLVFQGLQNVGKTAWLRSLVSKELIDYVKEDVFLDPSNKDSVAMCLQHWIVELGELDGNFRKIDIARLKGFISSSRDVIRRPYDRKETKYNRKTLFFATVNKYDFLTDTTGNARFWVLPILDLIDHDLDMQQVWAETFLLYMTGENWWLEPDQERQLSGLNEIHTQVSPIEELVRKCYSLQHARSRYLTATDVLEEMGFMSIQQKQQTECGEILRELFGPQLIIKKRRVYKMPQPRDYNLSQIELSHPTAEELPEGTGSPEQDDFL